MITLEKTDEFENAPHVVGCLVECKGKILLLHRNSTKPEGNTWGAPGGKVDAEESREQAVAREVFEETGIVLSIKNLEEVGIFYVIHPGNKKFTYTKFRCVLDEEPIVVLSENEHKDFVWVTPDEALRMPLIMDEDFTIQHAYGIK